MLVLSIIAIVCAVACAGRELARDLMMLQQNSYRNERYRRWLVTSADTTSVMRLVSMAVVLASLSTLSNAMVGAILIIVVSAANYLILAGRRYKKPLVWTPRARRIYAVMAFLVLLVVGGTGLGAMFSGRGVELMAVAALVCYCGSHLITLAANWLLRPVEQRINDGYRDDALRILASMPDLKIVGVTGSYGKTSTKHYLQRILSEQFDTLMTPGSFNTPMGVIRTVRENLKPYNEVFIVEMGAKQPGDVKEICDMVHPTISIVTAVGEQHLESFKTVERVRDTKFEIVDALPPDGLAVVNDDFLPAAGRKVDNAECLRYAVNNTGNADYVATDIDYGPTGTDFTVRPRKGEPMQFHTRLVGECNVSNLLAAIIVALRMGVPVDKIRYAVGRIEQVEHRLSVKRTPGGVTILDDAFNSNPTGSAMALDVLRSMGGGKRIVVTPGMIELGDRQRDANREFGQKIAASADVAIVVGDYNREAITSGIKEGVGEPKVYQVATFKDAQGVLASLLAAGDTVLYENDLPDTFK